MASYLMEVLSRAQAGREGDYTAWYLRTHLADMGKLDGVKSGRLQQRLDVEGKSTGEFVAHYEVETDDTAAFLQSIFAATPSMELTDAIDMESVRFSFLKQV